MGLKTSLQTSVFVLPGAAALRRGLASKSPAEIIRVRKFVDGSNPNAIAKNTPIYGIFGVGGERVVWEGW